MIYKIGFSRIVVSALALIVLSGVTIQSAFTQHPKNAKAIELRTELEKSFSRIQRLIKTNCSECHDGDEPEGDIDLSTGKGIDAILKDRKHWELALQAVRSESMPPQKKHDFSKSDRKFVVQWLEKLFYEYDCLARPSAGTVTLRRLNRFEYRNSIRELTGVDYQPAKDFPGDDTGSGFDNLADTLSLPTILLEKYLKAAEEITERAIVDPRSLTLQQTLSAAKFKPCRGSRPVNQNMFLSMSGTITHQVRIPQNGKYQLKVNAVAVHAGPDGVSAEILIDGKPIKKWTIPRRTENSTVDVSVRLPKGTREIGLSFTNDYYNPRAKRSERDRNLIFEPLEISGPERLNSKALPPGHRKIIFQDPAKQKNKRAVAEKILRRFASRAFRRPATQQEIDRLLSLFDMAIKKEKSFELAIRIPLQAILVSPHFLFKVEAPAPKNGKPRRLSQYELATSISFFIWSSTPDTDLLTQAFQSNLDDPKIVRQQIDRLLKDRRSSALVEHFARQWLQLDLFSESQPDPKLFPKFDDKIRSDMLEETRRTIEHVIQNDRSILELLTADYTFLNERLASFYSIDGVKGKKFRKVSLRGTGRGGIMTQGSILTMTSNPNRTSPVKRGVWVMNVIGQEPPPPDPNVMALDDQTELKGTLRERLEQHRRDQRCAICHDRIDPLGFSFENFDAVGRWRTESEGKKVDASAKMPDGSKINGAIDLQKFLATTQQKQFVEAFVEKMLTYATGRTMTEKDRCVIVDIAEKLKKHNYRFSELIKLICESDPFQKRQRFK